MKLKAAHNVVLHQYKQPGVSRSSVVTPETWTNIWYMPINPRCRDIYWRIAHRVLPVRSFMRRFITMQDICPLCCKDSEFIEHLFVFCVLVKPIWQLVNEWLSLVAGRNIVCDSMAILFLKFPVAVKQKDISELTAILCSELVSVIWKVRNETVFEKKIHSTNEIERIFFRRIKTRIKLDFHRKSRSDFENIWCRNEALATVSGDTVIINI
mgnify:CR=1 FL=1